jgi:hypothetical protein
MIDDDNSYGEPSAHVAECNDDVAECNDDVANHDNKPLDKASAPVLRDPVTGKFLPGTARGPGRPHGAKSQFNKQVVDSLQALWERDGDELLEQLARDKPEVIMAMVSRMIPQQLAAEAITGEKEGDTNKNTDVRITLVNQVKDDVALTHNDIPNAVEGELLPPIH